MTEYHKFVGIDIGKFKFVVAAHKNKQIKEYANTHDGINGFIKDP